MYLYKSFGSGKNDEKIARIKIINKLNTIETVEIKTTLFI